MQTQVAEIGVLMKWLQEAKVEVESILNETSMLRGGTVKTNSYYNVKMPILLCAMFNILLLAGCQDQINDAAMPIHKENEAAKKEAEVDAAQFQKMSPGEHLEKARNLPLLHPDTTAHLDAIPRTSKESTEADRIREEIKQAQKKEKQNQAKRQKEQAIRDKLAPISARQAFAKVYEAALLSQMMDAHVSTSGKEHTILRVEYILMNRPLVYNLSNDTEYVGQLRSMGFKKIIFTDGYDHSWSFTL